MLQVEALQAQLEEQTRLAKEQVDGLMDDRRVKIDEYETRRQRDQDKMKTLTEKLVFILYMQIIFRWMYNFCSYEFYH